MRWWMVTRMRSMAVENADVKGMDYTILPSNVSMVEWQDGRGEIECNDRPRLREVFVDVMPYAPLFQQFMTKLEGLTLRQSKKVQADLITTIFDCKRQLPYNYTVAAGNFDWDASDDAMTAMAIAALPALSGATSGGSGSLMSAINAMITSINSGIVNVGNGLIGNDNTNVGQINASFNTFNGNANSSNFMFSTFNADIAEMNDKLMSGGVAGGTAATPGLISPLNPATESFTGTTNFPATYGATFVTISAISTPGGSTTIPWQPIGSGTPVNLSIPEAMSIMSGIAARRNSLQTVKYNKTAAVTALLTVPAVIAYDVTTGW